MKLFSTGGRFDSGKRIRRWRILPLILLPVFLATMCYSAYRLVMPMMEQNEFEELSALIEQVEKAEATAPATESAKPNNSNEETTSAERLPLETTEAVPVIEKDEQGRIKKYLPLYDLNQEFFGWIKIPGTKVNYPVMHSPEIPDKYLHGAFDGSYSFSGVPFLSDTCYTGCGNYIIYGHNMNNGSMFNNILMYEDEEFWKKHPTIQFDTLFETGEYEIYSAFYSRVFKVSDTGVFRFYDYTDLTDESVFEEFAWQAKEASIYDTGVEAEYGDELITLITCAYHVKDGRFVLVAKKVN